MSLKQPNNIKYSLQTAQNINTREIFIKYDKQITSPIFSHTLFQLSKALDYTFMLNFNICISFCSTNYTIIKIIYYQFDYPNLTLQALLPKNISPWLLTFKIKNHNHKFTNHMTSTSQQQFNPFFFKQLITFSTLEINISKTKTNMWLEVCVSLFEIEDSSLIWDKCN